MSQERLTMRKIQEVLRLKWASQLSNRAIARSCSISHSTVKEYLQRAESAGLRWPLPEPLTEDELFKQLFPERLAPNPTPKALPDWTQVHAELRKQNVTLKLLWTEYKEAYPDGFQYSQYCERYRQWAATLNPPMRLVHKAGEKLFVDYAGDTVPLVDPQTGEITQAQIFVAVLGASSYTYAEAQPSQELEHWIGGHVRALTFMDGVPLVVVPDNLKSGVKHPSRYEPDLNPTYQELARHYGFAVIPARVRRPRDKAKVEVGVQVVERWILARLRHQTFFSLTSLNQAIRQLLNELNCRPMGHLQKSRQELFDAVDRPALHLLPATPYEFARLKTCRVNIDYHVEYNKHYYSVPFTLIHAEVTLRATERTVEILHKNRAMATHPRSDAPGRYTTLSAHMPVRHQKVLEWSPERFVRWAEDIGPATTQMIQAVLAGRLHPEQAYRSCLGILSLAGRFDKPSLENACQQGLAAHLRSYREIKGLLETQCADSVEGLPAHDNIRGKQYYQ
ncbi:MAG: IS21 family transposase [Chloroflexi bacterium]|nr:IS21 family transposase [Chloroflexota bacterium]